MIVITLTSCPPKLRGDLSKWLCEINTGVYVGNLSARVRDGLWLRVCENLDKGKATMVYSSNNEQHLEFCVHNCEWIPTDFDGITLIKRPLAKPTEKENKPEYYSKAGNWYRGISRRKAKLSVLQSQPEVEVTLAESNQCSEEKNESPKIIDQEKPTISSKKQVTNSYVIIDIETTGLKASEDEIIELAALKIIDGMETDSFSCLVQSEKKLPSPITQLTGITQELLDSQGKKLQLGLKDFLDFIGEEKIICHNLSFDMTFLQKACRKFGYPVIKNLSEDTVKIARKKIEDVSDYKLATLASHFGFEAQKHRALEDCRLLFKVYKKMV